MGSLSVPEPKLSLFSLPRRVRLRIYRYALKAIRSSGRGSDQIMIGVYSKEPKPSSPALLRACRAINLEATPVLYQINTFQFSYPAKALQWLNVIGTTNVGFLSYLRIFVHGTDGRSEAEDWYLFLKMLGGWAKDLYHLDLYLDYEPPHMGLGRSTKFYEGMSSIKSLDIVDLGGYISEPLVRFLTMSTGVEVSRT